MAEVERLSILINVLETEAIASIDRAIAALVQLGGVAEAVDNIDIDIDVRDADVDAALAKLVALRGGSLAAGGRVGGGGGGGGGTSAVAKSVADTGHSMDLLDLRMTDMHNALAKLVPLLLTLILALPALIGGLVALGAAAISAALALAALAGFGAIGAAMVRGEGDLMEGMMDIIRDIADSLRSAFMPLARRLAPLFEDALDGLERLFEAIAMRGDLLVSLSDEARAFGGFMMEFIPNTIAAMARMTAAFDPVFSILADFTREMNLLEGLTQFFADALPALVQFGALMAKLIPVIARLSIGFLRVSTAVFAILDAFFGLLRFLPVTSSQIGALIGSVLTLITAIAIWNFVMGANLIATLASLGARILALISTYTAYSASTIVAAASTMGLATALLVLVTVATAGLALIGIGIAASIMGDMFLSSSDKIDQATRSLKDFQNVAGGGMGGESPFGADAPTVRRGTVTGSRGGGVSVVVQGDANKDDVDTAAKNANYRLERPGRSV